MNYPKQILHWIDDKEVISQSGEIFQKYNPARGDILAEVAKGQAGDVEKAVEAAERAYANWSKTLAIKRAEILREAVLLLRSRKEEIAEIVAQESGKPKKIALGEIDGAVECGFFFSGEGRRYFGEVLTSAAPNRHVEMVRQSIGVGALIIPFNNPMASVAWKTFPALLCGNAVVLKSHEYTPYTALWFAKILKEAGLPFGVFNVIQGLGEAGAALTGNPKVKFLSFTGSLNTGRQIIKASADRFAKVSVEAGGKNPFVVCDDADLEKAASIASASAFVDGGQRCAAASRIIIFENIYEKFKEIFLEKIAKMKVGINDGDDYGAIISEKRMDEILADIKKAVLAGAKLLAGGNRIEDEASKNGYFIAPTVLENISPKDEISRKEIFGPVVILYRAKDFEEAINLANDSEFKLTGAIHTKSVHRAREFLERYQAGVARVNGPTFGSEPHMGFGGVGLSGNGWREPGTKALDFYSEWKQISIDHDPAQL